MNNFENDQQIDLLNTPISGKMLIEASAGTGKTFCIIIFYLRLLLNINTKNNYKRLFVQEILVLTFTNQSKDELFVRIKKNIHIFKNICLGKQKSNNVFDLLLKKIKNIQNAISYLKLAEHNIHNASIFTIHKFCKIIIDNNPFYFNSVYSTQIIQNEELFYLSATIIFWRKYCYKLPQNIMEIIYKYWKEPKFLLKEIKLTLINNITIYQSNYFKKNTLIQHYENLILQIKIFKKKWNLKFSQNSLLNTCLVNNIKIHNIKKYINIIQVWSAKNTENLFIPKELYSLQIKLNDINNKEIKYNFFKTIQKFLNTKFSIKEHFIYYAIIKIKKIIQQEKKNLGRIEINDLINILFRSLLKKNNFIADYIKKNFPVVFIDEFQDTNYQQYKIFQKIYLSCNKTTLILVSDPKQSIYSFRGSDIFSYFKTYKDIKNYYKLQTNWRSSPKVVNSINTLFNRFNNPFIFKKINFKKNKTFSKNSKMRFEIDKIDQTGLTIFFKKSPLLNMNEYLKWSSKNCANSINNWLTLGKEKRACIYIKNKKTFVKAKDITILVRNRQESEYVIKELNKYNIPVQYHSLKQNIYQTKESLSVLWILQSILKPTDIQLMQKALSNNIFLLSIENLYKIKNNYIFRTVFVKKFQEYFVIWEKEGIYALIKQIILHCMFLKNYTNIQNSENYFNNITQIAEILQYQSQFVCNKHSLLMWFINQIQESKFVNTNYSLPINNDTNIINIMTIHKSKGSEYPLVWIPFPINFSKPKKCIFHKYENSMSVLDLYNFKSNLKKSNKEYLSEEIRIIYVALTRAILHNSISIACVIKGYKSKQKNFYTDVHKSGFGYVLQKGIKLTPLQLNKIILNMSSKHFITVNPTLKKNSNKISLKKTQLNIHPILIQNTINDNWTICNYSSIINNDVLLNYNKKKLKTKINLLNNKKKLFLTTHNFPRGKIYGIFLHKVLENFNFLNKIDDIWLNNELNKINLSKKWINVIQSWIEIIINKPLNRQKIILSQLKKRDYIKELKFQIPIPKKTNISNIYSLIQSYNPISKLAPNIKSEPIMGILNGYIDMVFKYNNKYFIIDYKSNWLGKNNKSYRTANLYKTILKNHYDLQYIIYSLALHKYLKHRIKNYSFHIHFGGIFYLFLRAFNKKNKNEGIFFTNPPYSLIKKLNNLIYIK